MKINRAVIGRAGLDDVAGLARLLWLDTHHEDAAASHAMDRGAMRVTVHSGRRAVPIYERLGFASSRQLLQRPAE